MYQEMIQRSGLGDLDDVCCMGCALGTGCESDQVHGLGLTISPSVCDQSSPDYDPEACSQLPYSGATPITTTQPDFPTAAADVAQQVLERAIQFIPPAGDTTGQAILDAAATGANFVPGVGTIASGVIVASSTFLKALTNWLHIGAGRTEANLITGPPYYIQNAVFDRIKQIAAVGLNSNSIPELQSLVIELQQLRSAWLTFISNVTHFHDGRASVQAANTIMPYLDGTCGYHWPPPMQPDFSEGCGTDHPTPEGNAWVGDFGYGAGLLGALKRRIIDNGGQLPALTLTQGPTGIPGLYPSLPGQNYLPQAGTLPPAGLLPTWSSQGIQPVQAAGFPSSSLLAIGAGLLLFKLL